MRGHPAAVLGLVLALLGSAGAASEEPEPPTEYEVKAAFLHQFAKFVTWPDEAALGPTFVIAVLGADPFGDVLDRTVSGKTILGRRVEVRRLRDPEEAAQVQILFVGTSETARLRQVLKALEGTTVLTVADMEGFAERGGMIAFRLRDDLVRFDINLDQVKRARLKMSSQLIRLAQRVIAKGDV